VNRTDKIAGALLGTAVGDALGLPREGLSRRRGLRIYGVGPLRHRFVFGRGMVSDDTEHTTMVAQSLLAAPDDAERFVRSLAWRLRGWLLGLPAGVGFGTLRALLKLWMGISPDRSGVRSAGNGPAMRSPIIGVCLQADTDRIARFTRMSTRLTHTDPRAEQGALAVALAASYGARQLPSDIDAKRFLLWLRECVEGQELLRALTKIEEHLERESLPTVFADDLDLGKGVSGYINHTVPAALFCWLRSPNDFRRAVEDVVSLGGDTDTTGAIVGALAGATVGASRIPEEWISGLVDWPRSVHWMRRLASELAKQFPEESAGESHGPVGLFWPGILPRNLVFLVIVLLHGFRRMLPPY